MNEKQEHTIEVVGAAIIRAGRVLIAKRKATGPLPCLWEFPGGKLEEGETPEQAVAREIQEELGVRIRVGQELARGRGALEQKTIELRVFEAELESDDEQVQALDHSELRWVAADEFTSFTWAEADIPCLPAVRAALNPGT